ncbi:thioredoxin-disulfide reductase [Treponema sp. JC4]|uniref:thioredoxin-disulfide reductase n=1 Tax=Treponema sp. JC4 TaxID=1124982 RepID=UPI00025B026A|nr:thioredoxin-disulfide reductase [Treponema sp. JC4]EID86037.1 thioredoxin-disulfide reductase [Treponema sp. JC4]
MDTRIFDYVIIGAGPAGLASAQYAARGGLLCVVLDASMSGGQVGQISDLENYPGLYPSQNGSAFMQTMKEQAEAFGAEIVEAFVSSIDKRDENFIVTTRKTIYYARALCIATGAVHRELGIPGEDKFQGRGVSYCAVCDGPFFAGKKIFVVGGGDSACSEATFLTNISDDVSIIHRRDSFRAQKAVVEKMLKAGVKPLYDTVVREVLGEHKVEWLMLEDLKTGKVTEVPADALFVFTGMLPQTSLVDMLPKDEAGYIITDENMMTAMPGLFVAGDVRSKPFRQIVTAVNDGAIAAHSAQKFLGR